MVSLFARLLAEVWQIDANHYSTAACDLLLDTGTRIRSALDVHASNILVTTIMVGVLGCVPDFDTNFKRGFGVSTFGRSSLRQVASFYESNAALSTDTVYRPWTLNPANLRRACTPAPR